MEKIIILIPTYNPSKALISLVDQLMDYPFQQIIIVNDGSDDASGKFFSKIGSHSRVKVLNHAQNRGKGQAIKTGIAYILKNYKEAKGVLTCGADGQHQMEDIKRIAISSRIFTDGLILGIRDFNTKNLPKFSWISNLALSILFEALFHQRILDLQTGLRFFPYSILSWVKKVDGAQFNFDTNLLIDATKIGLPIYQVPVGKARFMKSGMLCYEEIVNLRILSKQMITSYLKSHETF